MRLGSRYFKCPDGLIHHILWSYNMVDMSKCELEAQRRLWRAEDLVLVHDAAPTCLRCIAV